MRRLVVISMASVGIASAAPLAAHATVHDTLASFAQIVPNQAQPVAPARSVLGSMFDGDYETMYSLGLGGSIEFEVAPTTDTITTGSAAELTFLYGIDQEAAQVYLGNNLGSYVYIGNLLNQNFPGGPGVVNVDPSVATLGYTPAGENTLYSLTVNSGNFNSLKFVDMSDPATSGDGFDIAEFSLTTTGTAISEPASLALLGGGLLAIGYVRRKRSS